MQSKEGCKSNNGIKSPNPKILSTIKLTEVIILQSISLELLQCSILQNFETQNASSLEDDDSSFRLQEPRYEPLEETKASQIITVDQSDSLEDLSLGAEARHLRNLQIDNSQDADFEKQISPLMSDEEGLKDEGTEKSQFSFLRVL